MAKIFSLIYSVVKAYITGYKNISKSNYSHNSAIDNNTKNSTRNRIINDQNLKTGELFEYGNYPARRNGCEAIAVHNAKVLMGMDSCLSDAMKDFQESYAMIGYGKYGSDPLAIGRVLRKSGLGYERVGIFGMAKEGIYIISFWNDDPLHNGLHTVAVSFDGESYTAYNLKCDGKVYSINPIDYRRSFICGYYLGK